MAEIIGFKTYAEWKTFVLQYVERKDTEVLIVDLGNFWHCQAFIGGGAIQADRNVKKGTTEETALLDDNWSQYPTISSFYGQLTDTKEDVIPSRGAVVLAKNIIHAPSENMCDFNNIVHTLDTTSGLLQIFRASVDNIHDVRMFIQGRGEETLVEDFEYADQAELEAAWVKGGVPQIDPLHNTEYTYDGTSSMEYTYVPGDVADSITYNPVGTWDWSLEDSISFRVYNNNSVTLAPTFRITIDDGSSMYVDFTPSLSQVWEEILLPFSTFTDAGVDLALVTSVTITLQAAPAAGTVFFDHMVVKKPVGTLDAALYDFGSTFDATSLSDGALMTLDDESTSLTLQLPINPNFQRIEIHKGSHERGEGLLTVGNYYGIYAYNVSSGDCLFFGSGSSQKYISGKTFAEDTDTLTELTDKTSAFMILSAVPSFVTEFRIIFDDFPGYTSYHMSVRTSDFLSVQYLGHGHTDPNTTTISQSFSDINKKPIKIEIGESLCVGLFDDVDESTATRFIYLVDHLYEPVTVYG
ncbi:MAG: hypothetical protein KAS32_14205 [Candidatus Peribacteraceae bacterium]|nr:hypothetical protein [Candidatus Peribacteraceae bacterium]